MSSLNFIPAKKLKPKRMFVELIFFFFFLIQTVIIVNVLLFGLSDG